MEIKINKTIKNCEECRHIDHSGGFTPGGAKPVCDHPKAVDMAGTGKDKYHWKHRVIPYKRVMLDELRSVRRPKNSIPEWCPLKNGCEY